MYYLWMVFDFSAGVLSRARERKKKDLFVLALLNVMWHEPVMHTSGDKILGTIVKHKNGD